MDKLFSQHVVVLYFFAAISIINYSKFSESQKLIILYIGTYLLAFLKILSISTTITDLMLISFIYSQYLTEDVTKTIYVKKLRYKFMDFAFLTVFQYHLIYIVFAIVLLANGIQVFFLQYLNPNEIIYKFTVLPLSIIFLSVGIHRLSAQPFKIKSFDQLIKIFNSRPIYLFEKDNIPECYYNLLVNIEDHSYFERTKTYNILSFEFLKYKLSFWHQFRISEKVKYITKYVARNKIIRGYSTIEMQLLRHIGIERGYSSAIRRKIYELIYTKIVFNSLRQFYANNNYDGQHDFKYYLIYIYLFNVETKVNKKYSSIISYLQKSCGHEFGSELENFKKYVSEEMFFTACAGLKQVKNMQNRIINLKHLIDDFDLDYEIIQRYINPDYVNKIFEFNPNSEMGKLRLNAYKELYLEMVNYKNYFSKFISIDNEFKETLEYKEFAPLSLTSHISSFFQERELYFNNESIIKFKEIISKAEILNNLAIALLSCSNQNFSNLNEEDKKYNYSIINSLEPSCEEMVNEIEAYLSHIKNYYAQIS